MTMKEDKTLTKRSSSKENEPVFENGKKKSKEEKPSTKVVVRRLPPTMTEEQFKMQVAPLPDFDYFYFVSADMSLSPNAFCRAYINFIDQSDLFIFTQKFDGYVFIDSKGGEFPAVVEFAPFQRIPKIRPNRKKDPKVGTIEAEPVFIAFKEQLEAENLEKKATANAAKQHFFETSLVAEKKEMNTPLLDYIKNRRAERQRVRDEKREEKRKKDLERRRAKEEQRRIKKEEDTSVVKTLPSPENSKPILTNLSSRPSKPKLTSENGNESEISHKHKGILEREMNISLCNAVEKQQIKRRVFELLCSSNKFVESNNQKPFPKFIAKHKDVEQEILKSGGIRDEINSKKVGFPKETLKIKNPHMNNLSGSSGYLSESIEHNSYCFLESETRLTVSNSPVCKREKPIILKPVFSAPNNLLRAETCKVIHNYNNKFNTFNGIRPVYQNIKKDEKTKDTNSNNNSHSQNFSEEVFRKNLQKVVSGVLGNVTVKSPRLNLINKPKVFIKRVVDGHGEQCERPRYNSPNFYLPPRAFGCGPSESKTIPIQKKTISPSKECLFTTNISRPLKTAESGKNYLPKFSLTLPPFSNKSVVYSKSDGDIEKDKSFMKSQISHDCLKRKVLWDTEK